MIGIEPMAWALGGLVVGATAMRWFVRHRLARFCDTLENGAEVSSSVGCEAVIADLVRARDRSVEAVRREQGLARRVAEEQASRLRRALGGLEDPVLVLDPGGGVTECNEAAIAPAVVMVGTPAIAVSWRAIFSLQARPSKKLPLVHA